MGRLCRRRQLGDVTPAFTAGRPFKLNANPPDGVLLRLDFYLRGDHATAITTAQLDGEVNIISDMQVTFQRRELPDVVWNLLPRDLKWITALFNGQLPATANPAGDAGIHFAYFSIFLAPPDRLLDIPNDYGLDTRDLSGDILIEGHWGAVTDIGTGATAVTTDMTITACVAERKPGLPPLLVLSGNKTFVTHNAAGETGPDRIGTGGIEGLFMAMVRTFDNSLIATDRPDGLITDMTFEHTNVRGDLLKELFIVSKKDSGVRFGLAAADLPAGIFIATFAAGGDIGDMPAMAGTGNALDVRADSQKTPPVEVTDVVPAAGDGFFVNTLGVQATRAGVIEARRQLGLDRAVAAPGAARRNPRALLGV